MGAVEQYWKDYLAATHQDPATLFAGEYAFGTEPQLSNELLALVLTGKKTATCAPLAAYQLDNEPLPRKGAYYVVTDWGGTPRAIVQDIAVSVVPYNAVTWEMAQKEGEVSSLGEWHEVHDEFLAEDSETMGYEVTPDMPMVFEEFRLVYR